MMRRRERDNLFGLAVRARAFELGFFDLASTITIDNVNGSNTAASGCGPSTAISGTNASFTTGSTSGTVTLDGSPNLSGITDNQDYLLLITTAGPKFFKITGHDNSTKTVITNNSIGGTTSGLSWGIGGKLKDLDHTNVRDLFLAGRLQPADTADVQYTGTNYTLGSAIPVTLVSNSTGMMYLLSSSGTKPTITTSVNSTTIFAGNGASGVVIRNLTFTNTASTRANWWGNNTAASTRVMLFGCLLDGFSSIISNSANSAACFSQFQMENCTCQNFTTSIYANGSVSGGSPQINTTMIGNAFLNCTGSCASGGSSSGDQARYERNIIKGNVVSSGGFTHTIRDGAITYVNNTVAGTAGNALTIAFTAGAVSLRVKGNLCWGNKGFAIAGFSSSGGTLSNYTTLFTEVVENNAYGNNASGNLSNFVAGIGDVTLSGDPFNNSANSDMTLNTGAGAGCRNAMPMNLDIGAVQHPDSGGGGGGGSNSGSVIGSRIIRRRAA